MSNEFNYQNITVGANKKIYTEKYRYYKNNGADYIQNYGVVFFPSDTMKEGKTLGILNVIIGTFEPLLPKGQVAMTPYYSILNKKWDCLTILRHPYF